MNRTETMPFSTEMCELQGQKKSSRMTFFIQILLKLQGKNTTKPNRNIPLGSL